LRDAVELLNGFGRALDIGCGTGTDSIFMAKRGLNVTAVDFIARALEFAKMRAKEYGVEICFIQADVTELELKGKFDLVFDSGCLHSFDEKTRLRYKSRLLEMMSPQSHYVLIHAGKADMLDFGIGPRPRTKEQIETFFMPELKLVDFRSETAGKPFCQYRFVRCGN